MRSFSRIAVVATAVGFVIMSGSDAPAGAAPAPDRRSELARLTGADLATLFGAVPQVFCGNRLIAYNSPSPNSPTKCVNGAENSGNSTNSGNYYSEGDPVNSGNFSNGNGATGSNNTTSSGNSANGAQMLEIHDRSTENLAPPRN